MPKLRQNPITGEWVVISPERAKRPEDFIMLSAPKRQIPQQECPFCKGGDAWKTRLKKPQTENYYIIPNKFPAFVKEERIVIQAKGFFNQIQSVGGHEVIVMTEHEKDIYWLNQTELAELFSFYQDRYHFYNQNPVVEYTMAIHNFGAEAGASVEHAHSQLFSSCVIPNNLEREMKGAADYYLKKGSCVFCDILREELSDGRRLIFKNDSLVAFTFFAARFPFEIWILPISHQSNFENILDSQKKKLAEVFGVVFSHLNKALKTPPFNFFIHSTPAKKNHIGEYYHWHIEVAPRVAKFGGYELGSGIIIDVVSPERAAEFLKK